MPNSTDPNKPRPPKPTSAELQALYQKNSKNRPTNLKGLSFTDPAVQRWLTGLFNDDWQKKQDAKKKADDAAKAAADAKAKQEQHDQDIATEANRKNRTNAYYTLKNQIGSAAFDRMLKQVYGNPTGRNVVPGTWYMEQFIKNPMPLINLAKNSKGTGSAASQAMNELAPGDSAVKQDQAPSGMKWDIHTHTYIPAPGPSGTKPPGTRLAPGYVWGWDSKKNAYVAVKYSNGSSTPNTGGGAGSSDTPGGTPGPFAPAHGGAPGSGSTLHPGGVPVPTTPGSPTTPPVFPGGGGGGNGGGGGGGGGAAPSSSGSGTKTPPKDMSDDALREYLAENYGYLAAFFDHPEIGPILKQAAKEGWTQTKLMGKLSATNWWKMNAETARLWEAEKTTDPATAKAKMDAAKLRVKNQAAKSGVVLSADRLEELADSINRFGWNDEQLTQAIATEAHYKAGDVQQGDLGSLISSTKALAAQYLIPVSDETAFNYAQKILSGEWDQDNVASILKDQAKGLFPQLTRLIDQGLTPATYLEPYKEMAARELEMNPSDIDWLDPKWGAVLNGFGDGKPYSLNDWQKNLRSDPKFGYQYTHAANQQAADFAEFLGNKFGKV